MAFLIVAATGAWPSGASGASAAGGARATLDRAQVRPAVSTEFPDGATNRGDDSRDGWYPNESGLSPALVGSSGFGQLFSTPVNGQVYAQPLLDDGTVLVGTETNWIYGLDPATGAIRWSRQLGQPYADTDCPDLTPDIGITSTPTVDPATGIAYLTSDAYLSGDSGPVGYFMHAIDPATGDEEPGFPVQIEGPAQNDPAQSFSATQQLQRPGLLLLGGVVYAGFASHCDNLPYGGLVAGVSTTGHQTTLWAVEGTNSNNGGGVWQSGGGLVSDGPSQILLATGNAFDATYPSGPTPGTDPPANLGSSVIRLVVQPDGTLEPTDFFTPSNALDLDSHDYDLGSGAPVVLPPEFGAGTADPNLIFMDGKEGRVYLLNRNSLGGFETGPGDTDGAVSEYGPAGSVWSTAGVWPGDGGYIFINTANEGGPPGGLDAYQVTGATTPTLTPVLSSPPSTGYGSSGPVVTSDGTTSGTAVLWIVHMADGSDYGSALQAYDPVPVNGTLRMIGQWPIGEGTKFNPPGIGGNRVYVGTQDGHVLGFGALPPAEPTVPAQFNSYREVASDGGVFAHGNAGFLGSMGGQHLNKPVVGMASTPDGQGYWLVASDGGVFTYGDAGFYGSAGNIALNKPIVGIAVTPDGKGYWLVASDGGVFTYGDAGFYGSAGGIPLNKPIVGMAAAPGGTGYWLVASDGGIFAYGDAGFYGSAGGIPLNKPIVGMAAAPNGAGYWLVASDGGVFTYNGVPFYGSAGGIALNKPIVGMATTGDGGGYWLVGSDGGIFAYGDALYNGSAGALTINKPIVGMAD
jgi:hypothetical protein